MTGGLCCWVHERTATPPYVEPGAVNLASSKPNPPSGRSGGTSRRTPQSSRQRGEGQRGGGATLVARPRPGLVAACARETAAGLTDSWRKLIRNFVQPVPLAAIRCHSLDGLYSTLTCTNGRSCWSPPEGNWLQLCRCKRHALPLRHTPINYCLHRSTSVLGISQPPV